MSQSTDEMIHALFASDLAQEVRSEFNQHRGYGADVAQCSAAVISAFGELLASPQEGPVIIVALAVLQWREGELHASVRDAAVELLAEKQGFSPRPGEALDRRQDREQLCANLLATLSAAEVVDRSS